MPLKASQKRNLRGQAHHLKPLVTVADKGLSDSVVTEIKRALNDHELIKVNYVANVIPQQWAASIAEMCDAELITSIGQVACFYRKHPENPVIKPG